METTQRERQLERRAVELEGALDEFRRNAAVSPGPCRACKYVYTAESLGEDRWTFCRNPMVAVPSFDPVREQAAYPNIKVAEARSPQGLCGPEGRLFRPCRGAGLPRWLRAVFGV